jgi:hypothetical protein
LFTRCDFIHWHVVKGNSNHMCCFINIWSNINIKIIMSCDIWKMVIWFFMHLRHHVFASFDLIAILTNQHATQREVSLDPWAIETFCHI